MKTKNTSRLLLAALFCCAASLQAQISVFSVTSDSDTGDRVQIAGLYTSQDSLVLVSSTSGYGVSNMSNLFGNYWTVPAWTGATVLANVSSFTYGVTTTITNTYAPNLGYNGTDPIVACSGRFYKQAQQWVWDDEWETYGHYEDPTTTCYLDFTVDASDSFDLRLDGQNFLSNYSLTGLENPVAVVYNTTSGYSYIGTYSGEGTHGLGTLSPGNYRVYIFGDTPTTDNNPFQSGIVVASIFAN